MVYSILLAAGLSKRFGSANKLLHKVDGRAIFIHTLSNIYQSSESKIILVTGNDSEALESYIPSHIPCTVVYNPRYESGMTSSIQAGVEACPSSAIGFMICLADQIKIQSQTYSKLIREYEDLYLNNPQTILVPSYMNQNGNPVILSSNYREEILALPESNGCKPVVKNNQKDLVKLELDDPGILRDIDTQADLKEL